MNERIKELAEQAEFSENDLHIQGDNFQKFADLLIDECIKMIDDAPIHHYYTTFDKSMAEGNKHDIINFLKLSLK